MRLLPNLINSILQSTPTKHRSKRLQKEISLRESSNEPSTLFAQDHILPLPLGLGHSSSQTRTHFRLGEKETFSDSPKVLTELLGYTTVVNPYPQVKMPFSRFVCFFFFQLEDNGFTILWWFLPYNSMNQPQVYGETAILL